MKSVITLDNVKKMEVRSEDLDKVKIPFKKPVELKVIHQEKEYYLLIYLRRRAEQLLVLSNGAVDPKKKTPPIYMRSSWVEELPGSLIFIDDPTLHGTNLKLGWGQGTDGTFFLENIASFIDKLSNRLKYKRENIYFYGSSAGGFMSMMYATMLKGSKAIVNNPQTNVLKYHEASVKPLLLHSYGTDDKDKVMEEFPQRVYVVEAFKYYGNIPVIYYFQNKKCDTDMRKHLTPLIVDMQKEKQNIKKLYVQHYFNKAAGHNPIPKEGTIRLLNLAMSGNLDYHI